MLASSSFFRENLRNEKEFSAFFEKNRSLIYSLCRRYTEDCQSAEDLTQEAFVKFYQNVTSIRGSALAFLKTIAANLSVDWLRKRKTRKEDFDGNEALLADIDICDDAGFLEVISGECSKMIRKALASLDDNCKKFLFYLSEGLKLHEIAGLLGVSESKIRSDSSRCRRKAIYDLASLHASEFSESEQHFIEIYFKNLYVSKMSVMKSLSLSEEQFGALHAKILERLSQVYATE